MHGLDIRQDARPQADIRVGGRVAGFGVEVSGGGGVEGPCFGREGLACDADEVVGAD